MRNVCYAKTLAARRPRRRWAPTLVALAALAAIPFGSLDALQERIASGRIVDSVPLGKVLRSRRDNTARTSYLVAAIKRHPPTRPTIYLMGGSSMRECIVGAGGLRTAIVARCGLSVKVISLASSEQKPSGQLAMVDNLPADHGGIIVIGIHHPVFTLGEGSATRQLHGDDLLVRSIALRDFLEQRLGSEQNASLAKGLKMYLDTYQHKRGVAAFTAPSLSCKTHRYPQTMTTSDAFKRERVRQWLTGRGRPGGPFFDNFALDAALFEETVKIARAKGFEVLFMESSQNAAIIGDSFDPYKEKYRALCAKLVEEQAAHYVNINRNAGLAKNDFYDLVHLLPSGRVKWQPRLANSLAEILTDHPPVTPPSGSPSPAASASDRRHRLLRRAAP